MQRYISTGRTVRSKAGLIGLTQSMMSEWGGRGISGEYGFADGGLHGVGKEGVGESKKLCLVDQQLWGRIRMG